MKIKQLNLDSFGKFKDKKIDLNDGINLVYGKNENGKSTIKSFVELVFSGLLDNVSKSDFQSQTKKYIPWYDETYKGSIIIEDENDFIIKRDFNNNEKSNIYYLDDHSIVDHDERVDQLKSVGLIGISEMKGSKGRELLADMINSITMIKKSNQSGLSYEEIIGQINTDIKALQENDEYIDALEQAAAFKEQIDYADIDADVIKELTEELNGYEDQLEDILENITNLQAKKEKIAKQEQTIKLNEFNQLKRQIKNAQLEIEALKIYTSIDNKDISDYLELKRSTDDKVAEYDESKEELMRLKGELSSSSTFVNERVANLLRDEDTRERLETFIDTYKATKNDIEDIKNQIDKYKEIIEENNKQNTVVGSNVTLSDEELEVLEKDYYKFVNTSGWRMQISTNDHVTQEIQALNKDVEKIRGKARRLTPLVFVSAMGLIAAIAFMVMFPFEIYKVGIIAVLGALLAYLIIRRIGISRNVAEVEAELELQKEQTDKNEKLKQKCDLELENIINKYNCDSYEAFQDYYKSVIPIKDNTTSRIHEKVQYLEDEKIKLYVKERITTKNIKKCLAEDADEEDEKIEEKIRILDEYINVVSHELVDKNAYVNSVKDKIDKLEFDIKVLNIDLSKNPIVRKNLTENISKIEESKLKEKELISLINSLETQKDLIKVDVEEEKLQLSDDENYNAEIETESIQVVDKELNDMKEQQIVLRDSVAKAKSKLYDYSEKLSDIKTLSSSYKYYLKQVEATKHKLSDLNNLKSALYEASNKVTNDYSEEIISKMVQIVYDITGVYDDIKIDDDMSIFFKEKQSNQWISVEQLSLGTIDQVYFALRIGLADTINSNVNLPLILDDSFIQYDGKRLEKILEIVSAMKRQVIILSCHLREKEIMDKNNINYNYIELCS